MEHPQRIEREDSARRAFLIRADVTSLVFSPTESCCGGQALYGGLVPMNGFETVGLADFELKCADDEVLVWT